MKMRSILLVVLLAASAVSASADDCPAGASWCSGLYRYDGMGNIRAIGSDVYVYDTAGRLLSGTAEVQRGGASRQDYGYDAFGNRISAGRIAGSVDCLGGCEQSPTIAAATNHITSNGASYDAPIWRREAMTAATIVAGPSRIDQLDATTVVPPGWTASLDKLGNILIRRGVSQS